MEIKKYDISSLRNIIYPIRTKHAKIFTIKFNPSTIRSAFGIFICRVFEHLTNLMKGHVHLTYSSNKDYFLPNFESGTEIYYFVFNGRSIGLNPVFISCECACQRS